MQVQEGRLKAKGFSEPSVRGGAGPFCRLSFDVVSLSKVFSEQIAPPEKVVGVEGDVEMGNFQ